METVRCELCGATSAAVVLHQRDRTYSCTSQEFTVVRCTVCRLLYLNPRPGPSEIGQYYPSEYFSMRPPLVKSGIRRAAKRLSGVVKQWIKEDFYGYPSHASTPGRRFRKCLLWPEQLRRVFRGREIIPWVGRGRLLDVGCGTGRNLVALTELGWDVYGVDISEAAVQSARSQFGHRVRHGDLKSISYSDGSFDVVLFSHSLEHMYSPVSVLQEVRRILSDEGRLIITLPNAGSSERRLFGKWWFPWELPRHLYHFEKRHC